MELRYGSSFQWNQNQFFSTSPHSYPMNYWHSLQVPSYNVQLPLPQMDQQVVPAISRTDQFNFPNGTVPSNMYSVSDTRLNKSQSAKSPDVKAPAHKSVIEIIAYQRPFTAYPFPCPRISSLQNVNFSAESYQEFRSKVLSMFKLVQRKRRNVSTTTNVERKKNSEASRKSKEIRKTIEDEMAIRCSFLEQENAHIRSRIVALKMEARRLEQVIGQ